MAEYVGKKAECVTMYCGADAAIQTICETFLNHDDELLVCSPTYMLYYKLPFRFGAKLAEAHSSDGVSTDLDALYNAITDKTKLVFICNPNNPTGTLVDNRKLDEFVEKLPPHVICVIDEAYYDWITEENYESALRFVNDRNNVIVLRTFSKIYGMAGLRVGYSVANKDITACLGCVSTYYNANRISAAGLDVVCGELLDGPIPLMQCDNTRITQHIAFATPEAKIRAIEIAADNLINWYKGTPTSVIM